jgi:tetratricopeptide (TPR) repeat protein
MDPLDSLSNHGGYWRLTHQVIAEDVLAKLIADGEDTWDLQSSTIASNLLKDLSECVSPNSEALQSLLKELFIDRQEGNFDGFEDRRDFSPLISRLDELDPNHSLAHLLLESLAERFPTNPHFWNHLGRHQIYKINRDLDKAEGYLRRAISIAPEDFLHHHTLGLAKRAMVRDVMRRMTRQRKSINDVLEAISEHFQHAEEAFETAQKLNRESLYPYVTHLQMITEVAKNLKQLARAKNLSDVDNASNEAGLWMQKNIARAEELLSGGRRVARASRSGEGRLNGCAAELAGLWGNFDEVIRLWELASSRGNTNPGHRRALAHGIITRANDRAGDAESRSLRPLEQAELERVANLMSANLQSTSRTEDDYRIWFESYRTLPSFDIDDAIGNLGLWTQRFDSFLAQYYLYVLHFYLWFSGRGESLDGMNRALARCKERPEGRDLDTLLWLGNSPPWCPLIGVEDLGDYDRKQRFWKNTSLLRRLNGMTEPDMKYQAGHVRLEDVCRAFFVPGDNVTKWRDGKHKVNFFLGFEPDRLNARVVEDDHVPGGDRIAFDTDTEGYDTYLTEEEIQISSAARARRLRDLQLAELMRFVSELVGAREGIGSPIELNELGARCASTFGIDGALEEKLGWKS